MTWLPPNEMQSREVMHNLCPRLKPHVNSLVPYNTIALHTNSPALYMISITKGARSLVFYVHFCVSRGRKTRDRAPWCELALLQRPWAVRARPRGTGKSSAAQTGALLSWIIYWICSTAINPAGHVVHLALEISSWNNDSVVRNKQQRVFDASFGGMI